MLYVLDLIYPMMHQFNTDLLPSRYGSL